MPDQPAKPRVLFFDVNETLLDLTSVKENINELLLDQGGATLWFSTMLHHSLVMTVSERHADLTEIGAAVLQMLARNRDISLTEDEARQVLAAMRSLPPHSDVIPALERLRRAGYRLATLTNSSTNGLAAQLAHASLADFFERQLSVEPLRRFKPHHCVYAWAADEMKAAASDCMLVAAHGWDVAGASWAGLQTAFVARPGQQMFPLAMAPEIHVPDLGALADALGA